MSDGGRTTMANTENQQATGDVTGGQSRRSLDAVVRLTVVGVTEKHGQAWDLICQADGLGTITVDPFLSCAWPAGTDSERRAMIGKEYMMANFQMAKDGCYLPETFCEPNAKLRDAGESGVEQH
jgi:hypothetical protein